MPLSLLHLLSVAGLYNREHAEAQRRRFRYWREGAHLQEAQGARMATRVALTAVHPGRGIPLLSGTSVSRHYLSWRWPSLATLSRRDGIYPIDTVLFDAGGLELYYPFRKHAKLVIYRVNDIAAEYVPQVQGRTAAEKEIVAKADLLFAVSQSIMDTIVQMRGSDRGVYLLPNGFDDSLFRETMPEPEEYGRIPAPRAVLLSGYLGSSYDWNLIRCMALLRPQVALCIIGYGEVPDDLPGNIHLLGIKPHAQVPAYLQHASVGLIPFRDLVRSRRVERPLKFYEYLAAGLPIVSVPYGSMTIMGAHATLASTAEEFVEGIDQALLVTSAERDLRKAAAEQFSWRTVFRRFEEMLAAEGITLPGPQ
jgi:glycosyltransferase involved in cell wall biosynthesis